MPISLIPPRKERGEASWRGRGSFLGIAVDRSTKAPTRALARTVVRRWEDQIKRGEYPGQKAEEPEQSGPVTFLKASIAYMKAGGDNQYLGPILALRGEHALFDRPIDQIGQIALDNAAEALYPGASAPTKNRQFYTPAAAVLHRAGVERKFKRPKGWRGERSTSWLQPAMAFALLREAEKLDTEFGLLCWLLCYTGMRISEPLRCELQHLDLKAGTLFVPKTKNGEPRMVHLPPAVIKKFRAMPPRPKRIGGKPQTDAGKPFLRRSRTARIFRFTKSGFLVNLLKTAMLKARLTFPPRQGGFHIFCHTYGTWLRRYGGLDNFGMVRTKRWLDPRSADRYMHTEVNEEARKADLFPVPSPRKRSA